MIPTHEHLSDDPRPGGPGRDRRAPAAGVPASPLSLKQPCLVAPGRLCPLEIPRFKSDPQHLRMRPSLERGSPQTSLRRKAASDPMWPASLQTGNLDTDVFAGRTLREDDSDAATAEGPPGVSRGGDVPPHAPSGELGPADTWASDSQPRTWCPALATPGPAGARDPAVRRLPAEAQQSPRPRLPPRPGDLGPSGDCPPRAGWTHQPAQPAGPTWVASFLEVTSDSV